MKVRRRSKGGGEETLAGTLSVHPDGYAFVVPDAGGGDLFIPARYLAGGMHGDRVIAAIVAEQRGGSREGRLLRVVGRAMREVVGSYRVTGRGGVVVPAEGRLPQEFVVPPGQSGQARDGQVVVAEITDYPSTAALGRGRVVDVLGWPDDPAVELTVIARKHGLPTLFGAELVAAAEALAVPVGPEQLTGRIDLRGLPIVTIDGENARDFDDAVAVERDGEDGYRLWVAIADVANYVLPGEPLDREAYLRGTSVYFPDRCLPMLPEPISNGICSLRPGEERLTMTAEMLFDSLGKRRDTRFYPGIIRSAARLTYPQVSRVLEGADPTAASVDAALATRLRLMAELAGKLLRKRQLRGSIDFDLPEPEIVLDLQGEPEAIVRSERTAAHRLIEEFMLAANEAVAEFIASHRVPSLYRVHEPPDPDKLGEFAEMAAAIGLPLPAVPRPGDLQRLLESVVGRPEERAVNTLLLRCMRQARYAVDNLGHYGLASACYTHFTSPIRRYPDLVVHRILKEILRGGPSLRNRELLLSTLPETAEQTSSRERKAMEAEREVVDLLRARYMQGRLGEEFAGHISGVLPSGIFVELDELFVEGMVRLASLPGDRYHFDERGHFLSGISGGAIYRLGDPIRVRVAGVSIERRQVEFVPADGRLGGGRREDSSPHPARHPPGHREGKLGQTAGRPGRKGPGRKGGRLPRGKGRGR